MMSEKRFKLDFDNHSQGSIMDRQDKYGQYCRLYDFGEVGRQQIVDLLNEQQSTISALKEENNKLKEINKDKEQDVLHLYKENERLKNKLNVTALELVDEAISMGKAVEISEMSYREFIDYRAENGKPMELQL